MRKATEIIEVNPDMYLAKCEDKYFYVNDKFVVVRKTTERKWLEVTKDKEAIKGSWILIGATKSEYIALKYFGSIEDHKNKYKLYKQLMKLPKFPVYDNFEDANGNCILVIKKIDSQIIYICENNQITEYLTVDNDVKVTEMLNARH